MVGVPGIASAIFSTVRDANINVVMISQVDLGFGHVFNLAESGSAQTLVQPRISIRQAGIDLSSISVPKPPL